MLRRFRSSRDRRALKRAATAWSGRRWGTATQQRLVPARRARTRRTMRRYVRLLALHLGRWNSKLPKEYFHFCCFCGLLSRSPIFTPWCRPKPQYARPRVPACACVCPRVPACFAGEAHAQRHGPASYRKVLLKAHTRCMRRHSPVRLSPTANRLIHAVLGLDPGGHLLRNAQHLPRRVPQVPRLQVRAALSGWRVAACPLSRAALGCMCRASVRERVLTPDAGVTASSPLSFTLQVLHL